MSITDRDAYILRRNSVRQRLMFSKTTLTAKANRLCSFWQATGLPAAGATPSTAEAPDRTTVGALGQLDSSSTQRVLRVVLSWSAASAGAFILADRLSHQGGLSGTSTSAQTTNLPTTALSRYTSGIGVELALEIYSAIGATATTVTASYTDETSTSGLATPTTLFGGTDFSEASRLIFLPLTGTSKGVKAVASVTLAATTGTAGNFGVTLYRPLLALTSTAWRELMDREALFGLGTFDPIVNGACLFWTAVLNSSATGILSGDIYVGED